MRKIIAVGKIFLFLITTFYHYSLIILGKLFSFLGYDEIKWAALQRRKWGQSVIKVLGINISVKGTPPKPPFFMVSNHLSYVDVWLFFSQLDCTFIAKSDVKDWPVIGFVLASSGVLFIDREKRSDVARVNEEVSKKLNSSQGIVLFPEGTTSAGVEILPFKSSLFQFPASQNLPVHCASIHYETPEYEKPAYQSICWWDDTPFFDHLFYLFMMKEFSATITFSADVVTNSDRKVLTQSSQEIVRESFVPVIDPEKYAQAHPGN
ncbi:MAG: 1-acyl-sn-glycerol-3-phosphate acyltransferase [Balneola sp.]|nr:MAG: 1-acyl-sn-glycerol-3-phosphate acyltransferase [Balneola sp.]